jgi:glutaredoxin-like YruB-family protein
MKNVTIYSTPSCVYCNMAKDYFTKHNVQFESVDVSTDVARRQEMIDKSGQMGVPVIFVGEEMVIGFDEPRLAELLQISA